MSRDVVVIGAGLAGLSAALRLAEAGRSVTVLARGVGSLHLGGTTLDVAGYVPERAASARAGLRALAGRPDHPYAILGEARVERGVEWLRGVAGPEPLVGSLDEQLLLPTAVGGVKPSALAPASVAAGDLRRGGPLLIAGFAALKDFYPALCCENLRRSGAEAEPVVLDTNPTGQADPGALRYVRAFEDAGFRSAVVRDLRDRLDGAERVGFPAVLGLDRAPAVWRELQDALERPVFEIPTLPPAVPGIRLYRRLAAQLNARGGRLVVGSTVLEAERRGGRVTALVAETSSQRPARYETRHVVLASGGVSAGGIELDSYGVLRETVLGLSLYGAGDGSTPPRFAERYLDEQPLARAGVAVDHALRPLGADGEPALANVRVAGATLAGAAPWREASGNGISVASGVAAAEAIIEEEAA